MSEPARSHDAQWTAVKAALREALDPDEASAWLPALRLAHLSRERAVLAGVPNAFFHQRILRQFAPLLRRSLAGAFGTALAPDFQIELRVGPAGRHPDGAEGRPDAAAERARAGGDAPVHDDFAAAHLAGQLPLFAEDAADEPPPVPHGAEPAQDSVPAEVLSFAAFQVGEENRIACAMARAFAAHPFGGDSAGAEAAPHPPLVLAGPSGSGKTHLLGAIAREFAARHPDWRIVRRSAEQFTVDVLDGIRRKSMPALRQTYRGADALLLDDLGFIEVSAKAQEELLHTFEALREARKPVAFAVDRVPSALKGLSEPLRSRLEAALVAELGLPGPETRRAILRQGLARAGLALAEPELDFLARRITGGARKLEGAVVRLAAHASLLRRPLDAALVRELAAPWLDAEPLPGLLVPPAKVLEAVCAEFGLTQRQLRGRERSKQRDLARQMAMRLLRERSGLSGDEIGRWLGNRAHSTVTEAIGALERKLGRDVRLKDTWMRLDARLG